MLYDTLCLQSMRLVLKLAAFTCRQLKQAHRDRAASLQTEEDPLLVMVYIVYCWCIAI